MIPGQRKAILIQDIRDFNSLVLPIFTEIYNEHNKSQHDFFAAYYMFICELIETIHNYHVVNYNHQTNGLENVFARVKNEVTKRVMNIDQLFSLYVRSPHLYTEHNQMEMVLNGQDIQFTYHWAVQECNARGFLRIH